MRTRRAVLKLGVVLALAGCDATFVDQRTGSTSDARPAEPGIAPPSAGDGAPAEGLPAGVFAAGTFEGRAGHAGAGSAELVRESDGRIILRLGSDFLVSGVPGPVVVLSRRDALGKSIDAAAGDLNLGTLQSTSGAQSYVVPGGDGGRRYVWVFCEPFAVEIARAKLEDRP
jgi:hypothetical protein